MQVQSRRGGGVDRRTSNAWAVMLQRRSSHHNSSTLWNGLWIETTQNHEKTCFRWNVCLERACFVEEKKKETLLGMHETSTEWRVFLGIGVPNHNPQKKFKLFIGVWSLLGGATRPRANHPNYPSHAFLWVPESSHATNQSIQWFWGCPAIRPRTNYPSHALLWVSQWFWGCHRWRLSKAWSHYTIKSKSWFYPQNLDLIWKYQVKNIFLPKAEYVPMVRPHISVVALWHIDKKIITFLRFQWVSLDRFMSI